MRLNELIDGIYTKPLPAYYRDFEVLTISCDSREEQKDGLFIALPGFKFNGEDFIRDAVQRGARIIVKQSKSNRDGAIRWTFRSTVSNRRVIHRIIHRFGRRHR